MYKTSAEAAAFAEAFKELYHDTDVKAAICAPFTQLETLVKAFEGTGIGVGAQNVHFEKEGAYTGEISVAKAVPGEKIRENPRIPKKIF